MRKLTLTAESVATAYLLYLWLTNGLKFRLQKPCLMRSTAKGVRRIHHQPTPVSRLPQEATKAHRTHQLGAILPLEATLLPEHIPLSTHLQVREAIRPQVLPRIRLEVTPPSPRDP